MATEAQVEVFRQYELRLLRCSLPSIQTQPSDGEHTQLLPSGNSGGINPLLDSIVSLIEGGHYVEALSCDGVWSVLDFTAASGSISHDPSQFYAELESSIESYFVGRGGDDEALRGRAVLVMSIAIAALLAFVQVNVIGPIIELPPVPLPWKKVQEGVKDWEAWARSQLMSVGSDLLGKFSNLQYVVFAKILLLKTKDVLFGRRLPSSDGLKSISWWIVRALLLQQRMLVENCSSLFDLLQVFMGESLYHFGNKEKVTCYWGTLLHKEEALMIVSAVELEAALVDYAFGRVDSARQHVESAEVSAGIKLSVTGALGFRTSHQVDPKAQLVLFADTSLSNGLGNSPSGDLSTQKDVNSNGDHLHDSSHAFREASDVLMAPRLLDNNGKYRDGANVIRSGHDGAASLSTIQQELVLAHCLLIEKKGRLDDMQRWEMAPYVEAIDAQRSLYHTVRCFCDILRVRWESSRGRTKERALTMMDKLLVVQYSADFKLMVYLAHMIRSYGAVHSLSDPHPLVPERIHSFFGVYMPTVPALRKEYGDLLVSYGLIGEAVRLFEELELWDNLIFCYRLLEKKPAAIDLIKTRLSETPDDPRLWCSLGDVTNDDACYEKALVVSNNRSARAKRSLARSAYNRGDYEMSKILWESAMALNSLYPDGWFALGSAALKAKDIDLALDGFTRAVQLDPNNGEAWHNIAVLHMIRKKSKEAFIAFKEALKFKWDSWQIWEIFSRVAVDVGKFSQAMEAIQKVFDLSGKKRVDVELLETIMVEMERRVSNHNPLCDANADHVCTNQETEGSDSVNPRETEYLMQLLGKTFQQIVRSGAGAEIWGLYARWHRIRGDLSMCAEALLKQVRAYQGSDLWKDVNRFTKFANASLELCNVYMDISFSTGTSRELQQAAMHLRNTIKQGDFFSTTEEYKALKACLDEVNKRLQANSESTT